MRLRYIALAAAAAMLAGCDDSPLDTNPTAQIDAEAAITNARGVELAVNGAYRALQYRLSTATTQAQGSYSRDLLVYPELYADNLDFTGTFTTDGQVGQRDVSASNVAIRDLWADAYGGINRSNNVLAAIPGVGDLTSAQRDRFRGEALFLRGLNYFNLVRFFGGVPILIEPSRGAGAEAQRARSTVEEVYAQIERDLEEAATLLPSGRVAGRATQTAANALLAKVYLEQGEWQQARDRATSVIGSGTQALVGQYRDLFAVRNSTESIFELQYSVNVANSLAFWFFPQDLGGRRGFAPSQELYNAYEAGDVRRDASIGVSDGDLYGVKFHRIGTSDDNVIVLRLAEMYLVRAEANARLGAPAATVRQDIDVVRSRAGLGALPASVATQEQLIDAILHERRVELAMEGHRFFDLRRTGRAEAVLDLPAWRLLFPIPQTELDVNEALEQNPGY
jgi:starch-binding outer membrane protein, SusD/RagB family